MGVIGAYIAETSTATSGPYAGLGREIKADINACRPRAPTRPPSVLFVFAIACFYTLALIERRLAPWAHRSEETSVEIRFAPTVPVAASLAVARAGAAADVSACGTKQDMISASAVKPFTVMLDWFPNADHAPLYSAIAGGEFRAVGPGSASGRPAETADPLKLLAAGKVDMAISYEPELLLARDQGLKLVSIAALVHGR